MPPPDKPFTIAIIGKQNIKLKDWQKVYDQIKLKIKVILNKNPAGNNRFTGYTALARGADTIFAEVVTKEFNQPLKIVLPFAKDEYRRNFTDDTDREVFNEWIKNNDVVVFDKSIHLDSEAKDKAYFNTGKYFIDHCDEIIIVWDNLKAAGKGGTADMLGLLAARKKSIKDIHIIEFVPSEPDELYAEIDDQKNASDQKAIRLKRRYTRTWTYSVIFAWLASISFAINAGFKNEPLNEVLTIVEFLCVLAIFIIVRIYTKNQHQALIRQRIKTEKLRLVQVFYGLDLPVEHEELRNNNDPVLSELILRVNEQIKQSAYTSPYYSYYCTKKLIEEQVSYHQKLLTGKSSMWLKGFKSIREVIIALFLVTTLASFISSVVYHFGGQSFYPHQIAVFLGVLFSTSFATIETILFFTEWRAEEIHSGNMLYYFKSRLNQMKYDYDKIAPGDLLKDISIKMLTENKNWEAMLREKQVELKVP